MNKDMSSMFDVNYYGTNFILSFPTKTIYRDLDPR